MSIQSKTEIFEKIVNNWKPFSSSRKKLIDIRHGLEYASIMKHHFWVKN